MRSLYFMSPHFHKSKTNISSSLTRRILVFFFLIFRLEILQKWRSKNYFHFEEVKYWCLLKLQRNMYDIFLISNGRCALRIANSFINKNDKSDTVSHEFEKRIQFFLIPSALSRKLNNPSRLMKFLQSIFATIITNETPSNQTDSVFSSTTINRHSSPSMNSNDRTKTFAHPEGIDPINISTGRDETMKFCELYSINILPNQISALSK